MDLDYNVNSGPFLTYEIEIGDGPGPELDNFKTLYYLILKADVWNSFKMIRNIMIIQ